MRSQNGIADIIRSKLLTDFLGKENAKHRRFLLFHLHNYEPGLTDDRMRKIYSKFPYIGWCRKGIYVIDSVEEVEKAIQTESKRRDSIEKNIEMLRQHKAYLIKRQKARESGQMNLFRGN